MNEKARHLVGSWVGILALLMASSARGESTATFAIRDHMGVEWGPAVVTYRVAFKPAVTPDAMTLTDKAGTALRFQLANPTEEGGKIAAAELRFLASVPTNGTAEYTLTAGGPRVVPVVGTPVTARQEGGFIELGNGRFQMRVPAAKQQVFDTPAEAATVPGPIQGVRLTDGTWAGSSTLSTDRKVSSFRCELVEEGPVSARVRIDYGFAPRGTYRVVVRLDQDAPLAQVEEEFDFGEFTDGRDFLALDLSAGWQPQAVAWASGRPFKKNDGFTKRMEEVKTRGWTGQGYFEMPLADAASEGGTYIHPWGAWGVNTPVPPAQNWIYMMPWADYGSSATYIGTCQAPAAAGSSSPQFGVLALHKGSWRRPSNATVRLHVASNNLATLELPISCSGVMRPFNPFDSAEEDPSASLTLGRRVWGLVAGIHQSAELSEWQVRYGMIGLDRYKDWVLEWDAKAELNPATYPRAYTDAKGIQEIRAGLEKNPLKKALSKSYLVDPTDEKGKEAAQRDLKRYLSVRATNLASHFRVAQEDNTIVSHLDAALAWPGLKDEARREFLAEIAAMAYLLSDPDFNPRGIGMHLGNPNMPINRYMGFPLYANLLPSHPLYKAWTDEARRYTLWKWANNVSPGGAWLEEITYQQAAVPHLMEATLSLRNGGQNVEELLPYVRELNRYVLDCVCPPDLNEKGLRGSEGTGNGGRVRTGSLVYAANLLKHLDPELAGKLLWLWDSYGQPTATHHGLIPLAYDTGIARVTPTDVPGAFLPGYGATARAHFGTPNETFLMFRCGYNQSHYEMDQGSFKFYAFGEHVLPNSSRGYGAPPAPTMQHGLLLFGDKDEPWTQNHGRVDSVVADYATLDTVDYMLGRQTFDDKSGGLQANKDPKAFEWYRQFLFLKSSRPENPSYFVLRDSLRGTTMAPSHFNTWVIGDDKHIQRNGGTFTVTTPQTNVLELCFVEPAAFEPRVTFVPTNAVNPFGISPHGSTEIRVSQPAGQGYLMVAYPRRTTMGAPKIEALAEGVTKIQTEEGTDVVFLSPDKELTYQTGDVSFTGRSGAVRIRKDEVRLILADGAGAVGYKQCVRRGMAPFDVGMSLAEANRKSDQEVTSARPVAAALPFKPLVTGEKKEVQPGVTQVTGEAGVAYWFDSPTLLDVTTADGVRFVGRQGAVEVLKDRVRYVLQPDPAQTHLCAVGRGEFVIRGEGPYDLTFSNSANDNEGGEVTGVVGGRARILNMPLPMNLVPPNCPQKALPAGQIQAQADGPILTGVAPMLTINGKQWQIGYYDRMMALSVFDGENRIRITRFQTPVLPPVPERQTVVVGPK